MWSSANLHRAGDGQCASAPGEILTELDVWIRSSALPTRACALCIIVELHFSKIKGAVSNFFFSVCTGGFD